MEEIRSENAAREAVERQEDAAEERTDIAEAEARMDEREAALALREQEIEARELRAEAVERLRAEGLPVELAEYLDYASAEVRDQSLERLADIVKRAVQAGVDARVAASRSALRRGEAGGTGALMAQVRGVMGLR